jgi:hypothetical protein
MRRVLIILLLLALVPLRAWAADAMAIQMAGQTHATTQAPTSAETAAAHAKCHEAQTPSAAAPETSTSPDTCTACAACQACFTVALIVPALDSAAQALAHGLPQSAVAQFTSATIALGQKPPIS